MTEIDTRLRILNLYAGIGGNRQLWPPNISVTAIERDAEIAQAYHDRFPQDIVIVTDAHRYLLEHYMDFAFIWSSPPCQTHGQYRYNVGVRAKGYKAVYPDMQLYEEIIFLRHHAIDKWVVENTISYYQPLIPPQKIARHYFWANFLIPKIDIPAKGIRYKNRIGEYEQEFGISLSKYKITNKRQVFRNAVDPTLGKHIFQSAMRHANCAEGA